MMTQPDTALRSIPSLVRDIAHNIQEIVRYELRLARTEFGGEYLKVKSSALLFAVGGVTAFFALLFALVAAMFGLAKLTPDWAAALILAAVLAISAAAVGLAGRKRFRDIHPIPDRLRETVKEDIQWAKQHMR